MIIESHIQKIDEQSDGRRYITEIHVDDSGNEQQRVYLAEEYMDVDAMLLEHQSQLNEQ
jgi:hypothetical protein